MEKCGTTDGETLCETIASGEWECMLGDGTITFNEAHESVGPHAVIGQWQNGGIVTIYPENIATGTYKTPDQFERTGN